MFSLVAVVFAWFNLSNKTPPIIIILGRIEVAAHLYVVNDAIESGLQYPVHRDEYQIQIAVIIEAVQADGGPLNNWFEPVKPWNKENWK